MKKYGLYSHALGPTHLLEAPELKSSRIGRTVSKTKRAEAHPGTLGLKPGEWVKVRTAREIFDTLDSNGRHKGLGINPEQVSFCGKKFRVFKVVDKIRLESTGELRRMKAPTVLLEGAVCDGRFHGGCDRSCFCFWREEWLERAPAEAADE
ncbi:MAG TPA: hypothetical protein VJR06_07590 [Nitrososphaerales archaeon]|nr:hypothetical protein [Nitrososphaerales archaeon]